MIPALKAEFRKLVTVRSTYGIIAAALVIVALFAGFGEGFRGSTQYLLNTPDLLASESRSAIVFVGLVLAFAGLLLMGHEYRYTTIMYTLTTQNRRYKVLLAKLVAISTFALATTLLVTFFSPLCTIIGAHLHGHQIGPQTFDYWSVIWRCLFCGWGYALYAFMLAAIMRNQIGAIVTFLLVPLVGENILTLLLKNNAKYLPFTALQSVVQPSGLGNHTTVTQASVAVLAYVAVGLLASFVLFWKRDAN
jgi:ABC-type transport system involved in multi-copper enzyme maturation permease subunit